LGFSIGVTIYPQDKSDANTLINHAVKPCTKPNAPVVVVGHFGKRVRSDAQGFGLALVVGVVGLQHCCFGLAHPPEPWFFKCFLQDNLR
jgi:hypothetical protein